MLVLALAGTGHRGSSTQAFGNATLESDIHAAQAATAAAAAAYPGKRAWYNADLSVNPTPPACLPPPHPYHTFCMDNLSTAPQYCF